MAGRLVFLSFSKQIIETNKQEYNWSYPAPLNTESRTKVNSLPASDLMCLNDRPLTDKWCSPSVMPPQPGPTCRGCLVIGQRQWCKGFVDKCPNFHGELLSNILSPVPVSMSKRKPNTAIRCWTGGNSDWQAYDSGWVMRGSGQEADTDGAAWWHLAW